MDRRALAAGLVIASTAFAAQAEGDLGVLAVAEPPGPDAPITGLTARLHEALAAGAPEILDRMILRERMGGAAPAAALSELDRAYAGALAAHASGDFEGAARTLREVVLALERLPSDPSSHAQWTRAGLRLARFHQAAGRRVEAQAVLERLLAVDPGLRPDIRQFPPSFVRLSGEVAARVRSGPTHLLAVEGEPGTVVHVEGREVGQAPLTITLPPGRYRVHGVLGALRIPGPSLELRGDAAVRLDAEQARAFRPDAGPGLALPGAARAERLVAISSWLGLGRTVVASLVEDEGVPFLTASLLDVGRGRTLREGRLRLQHGSPAEGGIEALSAFLLAGKPSPLVSAPPAVVAPLRVPPPQPGVAAARGSVSLAAGPEPRERRSGVLGWTATGTGAAALVLGAIGVQQAVVATGKYDDAGSMRAAGGGVRAPYTVRQYNSLVREADRARANAIGMGVGAGVALGATAVLGYLSWRETGEIGPFRF